MAKGILLVESYPESAETAALYHEWYNEKHIPQIVSLEGFVAARRFTTVGEDGPFVAIYEIEADDIEAAQKTLSAAVKNGDVSPFEGMQVDPPPTFRWLKEFFTHAP